MATMNISLPDKMKEWVEAQTKSGRYGNASDYVRDLIRRDKEAAEYRVWINAEVEKGYASGFSEKTIDEIFDEMTKVIDEEDPLKKTA